MKAIAWLAGLTTIVVAAAYMIVSLNRWEWNRALFFGLIVLIAEVALATAILLRRLGQLQRRDDIDPAVLEALRKSRPTRTSRFAWLEPTRMNVFITFLVGGGVLLSGIAWVVDRIASKTTTPVGEERLARQLGPISYPRGGLIVDDVTVLAQAVPGCDDTQLRRLLRRAGHSTP
jgi:hypothetical protein